MHHEFVTVFPGTYIITAATPRTRRTLKLLPCWVCITIILIPFQACNLYPWLIPLIFWGSGGFHQTFTAVEFSGSARRFTGGASGTGSQTAQLQLSSVMHHGSTDSVLFHYSRPRHSLLSFWVQHLQFTQLYFNVTSWRGKKKINMYNQMTNYTKRLTITSFCVYVFSRLISGHFFIYFQHNPTYLLP